MHSIYLNKERLQITDAWVNGRRAMWDASRPCPCYLIVHGWSARDLGQFIIGESFPKYPKACHKLPHVCSFIALHCELNDFYHPVKPASKFLIPSCLRS